MDLTVNTISIFTRCFLDIAKNKGSKASTSPKLWVISTSKRVFLRRAGKNRFRNTVGKKIFKEMSRAWRLKHSPIGAKKDRVNS